MRRKSMEMLPPDSTPLVPVTQENTQIKDPLLNSLADHYLVKEHPQSTCYQVCKCLLLAIGAAAYAWQYVQPSFDYGDRFNDKQLGWTEVVCNVIAAGLVFVNVSLSYITYLEKQSQIKKTKKKPKLKTSSRIQPEPRAITQLQITSHVTLDLEPTTPSDVKIEADSATGSETQLKIKIEKPIEAKKELSEFIAPSNHLKLKNTGIAGGALISAVPLAAPAIQFTTNLPLWLRILEITAAVLTNGFIHTLPMMLLVLNRIPRFLLTLPFQFLYYCYEIPRRCLRSKEEVDAETLAEATHDNQQKLKTKMAETLEAARKKIFTTEFLFAWCKFTYQNKAEDNFKNNYLQANGVQRYEMILEHSQNLPPPQVRATPWLDWFNHGLHWFFKLAGFIKEPKAPCPDYINAGFQWFFWLLGLIIEPICLSGFMMSTYNESEKLTDSSGDALGLTILPAFIASVLVGYYGAKTLQNIYDFGYSWYKKTLEIALVIKAFPKTLSLLLGIAGYIAYYSSGPAQELVYTNFADEKYDSVRDILVGFARYGVIFFSFINLFEICCTAIKIYAKRWGTPDEKFAFNLNDRLKNLEEGFKDLDGPKVEATLRNLPKGHQQLFLGTSDDKQFQELTDHKGDAAKKLGSVGFFPAPKTSGDGHYSTFARPPSRSKNDRDEARQAINADSRTSSDDEDDGDDLTSRAPPTAPPSPPRFASVAS